MTTSASLLPMPVDVTAISDDEARRLVRAHLREMYSSIPLWTERLTGPDAELWFKSLRSGSGALTDKEFLLTLY